MRKKIMIPVDFSVPSLNTLKHFLIQDARSYRYDVLLTGRHQSSSSINDLLFFSKKRIIREIAADSFIDALMILKNKFADKINIIELDLFTGHTRAAFSGYLKGHDIEEIIVPKVEQEYSIHYAAELSTFIHKCRVKKVGVDFSFKQKPVKHATVSALFETEVALS